MVNFWVKLRYISSQLKTLASYISNRPPQARYLKYLSWLVSLRSFGGYLVTWLPALCHWRGFVTSRGLISYRTESIFWHTVDRTVTTFWAAHAACRTTTQDFSNPECDNRIMSIWTAHWDRLIRSRGNPSVRRRSFRSEISPVCLLHLIVPRLPDALLSPLHSMVDFPVNEERCASRYAFEEATLCPLAWYAYSANNFGIESVDTDGNAAWRHAVVSPVYLCMRCQAMRSCVKTEG